MAGRIAYYGNITTQGLVLDLDAAIQGSYPKTGSTWFDISNNGNNGTLTNGPLYTGSDYGAIRFDGTNDYINTPYTNPIGTSDFSYNTWINFTSSQLSGVITKRIGVPTYEQFSLYIAGNTNAETTGSKFVFNDVQNVSNLRLGITSGSYNDGRWHNVTLTRTSTTTTMYVEGAPTVTVTSSPLNLSLSTKLFIGVMGDNQSVVGNYLSGSIASAQVYNQALSQFQVWQNFNAYKSRYGIPDIVTDGLILNLDAGNPYSYLSGSSGTTWTNTVAASSSISGTLVNGPVYSNGAITFDGVDDYVRTDFNVNLDEQNMSICFFFKNLGTFDWTDFISLITTTNYSLVFEKGGDNGFPLTNGYLKVYPTSVSYTSSLIGVTTPGFFVQNSNIHYIVLTTSPSQWNLYSENGLYASGSVSGSTNYFNKLSIGTDFARIGGYPRYSKCSMYTVQVYNRGLTSTEVQQNFNALRGRYGI